jgi:hypothetical protein
MWDLLFIFLGLNLFSNFLPGLREALHIFIRIILIIFLIGIIAIIYMTKEVYQAVECSSGNVSECYADNYQHETLENFSADYQLAHDPPIDQQTITYMKRFTILRHEYYVDQLVTTRMDCVYMSYPIPTEAEHCMPRYVVGGPYDGNVLQFPTDDFSEPGVQAHRDMVTQQVRDDWAHTTW